jgi:AcrR family transcriptional regulator
MEAALELFTAKGYASTTVREIVKEAGVTKPVLYYYFRNKEGVYLEILGRALDTLRATVESQPRDARRAEEGLRNLCDTFFVQFRKHIRVVRLVYATFYGPPQGAPPFDFGAFHELLSRAILHWIDLGVRRGEFRRADRTAMTMAVHGALNVAMEIELAHGKGWTGRKGLHAILDVIFKGLRAGKPAKEEAHGKR